MNAPSRRRIPRAMRSSTLLQKCRPGSRRMDNIRRAGPADAAAIAALSREAYAKWVPVIGRAPKPMAADYDVAVREHLIDLPEVDGELVALVECIQERDHLLIENLAVAPAHQGQGHGHRLIAHVEALARE